MDNTETIAELRKELANNRVWLENLYICTTRLEAQKAVLRAKLKVANAEIRLLKIDLNP